jgi:hypothetical protein
MSSGSSLSELALDAIEFFRIPVNWVVKFGGQVEISAERK